MTYLAPAHLAFAMLATRVAACLSGPYHVKPLGMRHSRQIEVLALALILLF